MLPSTRNFGFMAWTASLVVTLGLAAGASAVVPNLVNAEDDAPATAPVSTVVGPSEDEDKEAAGEGESSIREDTTPDATPDTTVAPPKAPAVTAPPTTEAHAPPTTAAPVVQAPPPSAAPAPSIAPRRVPGAAEVQQAIAGISGLVQLPFFFTVQPSHVADVGNQVCTAFDQGQTFAQVKATGLATVSAYLTVSDAAADYTVRTAVAMYCPGYTSRLG